MFTIAERNHSVKRIVSDSFADRRDQVTVRIPRVSVVSVLSERFPLRSYVGVKLAIVLIRLSGIPR